MKAKQRIVDLPVYKPGKPIEEVKKELGLKNIIKLASNENPYGCSPKVNEAVIAELEQTNMYPDGASSKLRQALAAHLNIEENQFIFGAGSDDVLLMICRAYLEAGDETVMATPTFPQYKHNAEIEGAVSIEVPLNNGNHDLPAMAKAITEKTKIVWVCNPNNPTGTMVSHEELVEFMQQIPTHILVVIDEAYVEYNYNNKQFPRSLELLQQYDNMMILRTFSKIYGLAAHRIGYGIANSHVIQTVNQVREPFNTTRFAQAAAIAAIRDQAFVTTCCHKNEEGIHYLSQQFNRLKLQYFPAHGNFIMVHLDRPAEAVFEYLLSQGIIVRGGNYLGYPTSIRVTVGTQEQNVAFITALEKTLQHISPV
ncbi:histidinol-phosphate transaminase [Longirhabdus pacifica]|uniref:histidinol-phosphate transaminase n=1 Tax=Longirhabdus pacifica TaxID=2305227 RepID=UPI001008BE3E|nr:histidinol-phosphate transaminase [Longirhabdus pacifica]